MQPESTTADPVVLVADAGAEVGLGHLSRSSSLAVALVCRGLAARCYAIGAGETFERDGVRWSPLPHGALPEMSGGVLVVDSYTLPSDELETVAQSNLLVVMYDFGDVPRGAALVVSPAGEHAHNDERQLRGLEHAALRAPFWGLPTRLVRDDVERVLVTTGSGKFDQLGQDVARAVASALPTAAVTRVRGPYAGGAEALEGVNTLDAPDSLLDPLLSADLVVTAGGQTMLEAAAAGTACVALPIVENQKRQVQCLARAGAVCVVEPPHADSAAVAVVELANDPARRRELSARSQQAIDGYGALRVAFEIDRLARQR